MAKKLHIRSSITTSYTECGRVIVGGGIGPLLDPEKSDINDPRVCKWCRITYESRKRGTDGS